MLFTANESRGAGLEGEGFFHSLVLKSNCLHLHCCQEELFSKANECLTVFNSLSLK